MRLRSLRLHDFRNHKDTSIECGADANIFVGRNGEGKTNILEGIAYLCLGKSFYAASDNVVLRLEAERFAVTGQFLSDRGVSFSVEAGYEASQGVRRIRVGGSDLARRADLIGMFPVVVLSPEYAPVTTGGPGERRKLLDTTLSQSGRRYLEDLVEYRKALRQRNRLLTEGRQERRTDTAALLPWTEVLIERGARITQKRREFIEEFHPYVADAVSTLSGRKESPELMYEPSVAGGTERVGGDLRTAFAAQLESVFLDEHRAGTTLVGPHRDEIGLRINGLSLRQYASQGQHKTFLVGLKLAEFQYLKDACGETPLLLLDDIFSELDPERNARVVGLTGDAGQVFITAADERLLPGERRTSTVVFAVNDGTVTTSAYAEERI